MPVIEDCSSTSASLLRRVGQFDAQAWQRLVKLYSPLVYRWCRQAGLAEADVSDVMQEVFLAVARGAQRFYTANPRGKFRAWLWGTTRNKLADYHKQLVRSPTAWGGEEFQAFLSKYAINPPEDSDPASQRMISSQLLHRAILLLKDEFSTTTWQAFWRTVVGRESTAEVAANLNTTSKAVRQARYRVLRRLRQEMFDLLE